jgi:hypothetical protein
MTFFGCLDDHTRTIDMISLALTSRAHWQLFLRFVAAERAARQRGIRDLALDVFKSKYYQSGVLHYVLLEFSGKKLDSVPFLCDVPLRAQETLAAKNLIAYPAVFPSDLETEKLVTALHREYVLNLWLSFILHPDAQEHTFCDPESTAHLAALCADEISLKVGHRRFSQLTDHILVREKNTLVIDDDVLRGLCYWQLGGQLMDVAWLARHYSVHLNQILPWIMLLAQNRRVLALRQLRERFTEQHAGYLRRHLSVSELQNVMQN